MHRRLLRLLPLAFLLFTPAACEIARPRAAALEAIEREGGFDVEHYHVRLRLLPEERRIEGSCDVRLFATRAGLERVVLDLKGLEVRGVTDAEGRALPWQHDGARIGIDLSAPLSVGDLSELSIAYGGSPRTGLWFSGERLDGSGPTQVFTQGEAEHSSGWFPCFDHPSDRATFELEVTMPANWIAVAPGERIDRLEDPGLGLVTEHWSMTTPHASYLASLVAGELVAQRRDWEGIPISFLAEPRYEDWIAAAFDDTDEILAFLSEYTGRRYPYPKYSQAAVANFPWGGMENISATTLTPLVFDDERGLRDDTATDLIVHEAAHQWFGDLLTCDDWEHLWLNEGFASYFEALYKEATEGRDALRIAVRDAQDQYIAGHKGRDVRPIVWGVYRDPEDLFTVHPYQGAAVRLHLLRFLLGDGVFQECVRAYVAEFAERNVVTADLQRVFERVSGRDLDLFFEEWFERPGYPEFRTEWEWDAEAREVVLEVRQLQDTARGTPAVFHVPVDVEVLDETGTRLHRIEISRRKERFRLPAEARPFYVRFDKGGWIPKTMVWDRSPAAWIAIADSDDDVNGRRDAVRALGRLAAEDRYERPEAHETYVAELVGRLRRDPVPAVRAAAASALGQAGGIEARARLEKAAQEDPEAAVRVAALSALRAFCPDPDLARLAERCFDEGYSWNTMGAAAGLFASAAPERAYGWLTAKLFIDSPHDQLCSLLLTHLARLDNPGVNEQLLRWARDPAVHPTARAVAVRELAGQDAHQGSNVRALVELLGAENFRLQQAVVEALARIGSDRAKDALADFYPRARRAEERRVIERALVGHRAGR